jgi:hypothetical protein
MDGPASKQRCMTCNSPDTSLRADHHVMRTLDGPAMNRQQRGELDSQQSSPRLQASIGVRPVKGSLRTKVEFLGIFSLSWTSSHLVLNIVATHQTLQFNQRKPKKTLRQFSLGLFIHTHARVQAPVLFCFSPLNSEGGRIVSNVDVEERKPLKKRQGFVSVKPRGKLDLTMAGFGKGGTFGI